MKPTNLGFTGALKGFSAVQLLRPSISSPPHPVYIPLYSTLIPPPALPFPPPLNPYPFPKSTVNPFMKIKHMYFL